MPHAVIAFDNRIDTIDSPVGCIIVSFQPIFLTNRRGISPSNQYQETGDKVVNASNWASATQATFVIQKIIQVNVKETVPQKVHVIQKQRDKQYT